MCWTKHEETEKKGAISSGDHASQSWLTTANLCEHLGAILLPHDSGPRRLLSGYLCIHDVSRWRTRDSLHILSWPAQLPNHCIKVRL